MKKQTKYASLLIIFALFAAVCIGSAQPASNSATSGLETLTNGTIIELKQLGLGDAVIIDKIKTTPCEFDVTLNGLKQLKAAQVSDGVISAMLSANSRVVGSAASEVAGDPNDPSSPHEAGIWLFEEADGKSKMTKLEPSVYSQAKTGVAIFAGFGQPIQTRAVIRSANAETVITNRRPVFYFYFEKTETGLSDTRNSATSPNEFVLSQFEVNVKDNQRSLMTSEINVYSGSRSGADGKFSRSFSFEKLGPGIYKVSPKEDLANGEYGFYYGGTAAVGPWGVGATGGKVFDFGIKGSPETEPVTETPASDKKPAKSFLKRTSTQK